VILEEDQQQLVAEPEVEDEETKQMKEHNLKNCPQSYMLMFNVQK